MSEPEISSLSALLDHFTKAGVEVTHDESDNGRVHQLWPVKGEVFSINIQESKESTITVWVWVRTTSWSFEGERSDLNDLFSATILICLTTMAAASPTVVAVPHPAVDEPAGIYARVMSFERDGLVGCAAAAAQLAKLRDIVLACMMGFRYVALSLPGPHRIDWEAATPFAKRLCKAIGKRIDAASVNYSGRKEPNWRWFHEARLGVSLFHADGIGELARAYAEKRDQKTRYVDGPNARLAMGEVHRYAIPHAQLALATQLIGIVESSQTPQFSVFPAENCFIAASQNALLQIFADCGSEAAILEIEAVRKRHVTEREVLFRRQVVQWNDQISDDRFEELTHALLFVESGVQRVRRIGKARDPDGGRDLEADWMLRSPAPPLDPIESPFLLRRVLVQCKALKSTVGKSHVRDIRDTVEHHDASGYLLVVLSTCSAPLVAHLNKLRQEGRCWVDWWTRDQLEDRLRQHPDVASRFPDILRLTEADSDGGA